MAEDSGVRLDKWLWSVRVYKTRALASKACAGHLVYVNGQQAKASRNLHVGDQVVVRDPHIVERNGGSELVYIVKQTIDKRVGAKLVADCVEDQTVYLPRTARKLSLESFAAVTVHRGEGRPRKRDRRRYEKETNTEDY